MNSLTGAIGEQNLARLLMEASVNSFVILVLTMTLILSCRRGSAATRHSMWFVAVCSLLFLPLFSLLVPAWQKPLWSVSTNVRADNELMLAFELGPNRSAESIRDDIPNAATGTTSTHLSKPRTQRIATHMHTGWTMIGSVIWATGVATVLAHLGLGRLRLWSIQRHARPLEMTDSLRAILYEDLRISRCVTFLESQDNLMPMTWGWWRPVVLLPKEARQWPQERLQIVLRHELAHVKRWDCLSQFITQVGCAFYWFNPLMWLAARRMCVERERACDDLVLAGGCKASDYASHLLEIARSYRRAPQVAAIGMARSSQLGNRITAIVDSSVARRAPRTFVLSLLWAAMLSLAATIAAQKAQTSNSEVKTLRQKQIARLETFSSAKEKQSAALAAKAESATSPEFQKLFAAAIKGDGQTVTNMYEDFVRRNRLFAKEEGPNIRTSYWRPVLEISMAYSDVMAGEPKYNQLAIDDIVGSIPRGSIYFCGNDSAQALPTAFCKSDADADPFFILSQNALADGEYLDYLRSMYDRRIYILTKEEADKCFQEYLADAQRRLEHDSKFPNEPKQIKPGEDVRKTDNKIQVSGHVAVMAVNGLMCKLIFEKNPDREFYVAESFPLDWMYPHLEPHGFIMKINRQPLKALPEETTQRDHEYWQSRVDAMIGKWLIDETSVQTIAEFVEKVYLRKDLSRFTGDPRFVQNGHPQRMFSKWRSSIGGLYKWRVANSKLAEDQRRMIKEADFAFRQAVAICPASPETIYRYVDLLTSISRLDDAIRLAEMFIKVSPDENQPRMLLDELRHRKSSLPKQRDKAKPNDG
jgi:beta-lactamase regulating signal transducer with metallopeptidase domain